MTAGDIEVVDANISGDAIIRRITPISSQVNLTTNFVGFAMEIFNDGNSFNRDGIRFQCGSDSGICDALTIYDGNGDLGTTISAGPSPFGLRIASDMEVRGEINATGIGGDGTGKVVCIKADQKLGTCTEIVVNATGICLCS